MFIAILLKIMLQLIPSWRHFESDVVSSEAMGNRSRRTEVGIMLFFCTETFAHCSSCDGCFIQTSRCNQQ